MERSDEWNGQNQPQWQAQGQWQMPTQIADQPPQAQAHAHAHAQAQMQAPTLPWWGRSSVLVTIEGLEGQYVVTVNAATGLPSVQKIKNDALEFSGRTVSWDQLKPIQPTKKDEPVLLKRGSRTVTGIFKKASSGTASVQIGDKYRPGVVTVPLVDVVATFSWAQGEED
jgi:hypothetical protein